MPLPLDAPPLADEVVRLEPLRPEHAAALGAAADAAREAFGFTPVPTAEGAEAYVAESLARRDAGRGWPFVQLDAASGAVLGHTSFLEPRWWPGAPRLLAVEIGATWLAAAAQGTAANPAAKRLLLRYAFEAWGVERVDIKTDARNARARASILALGARLEGVLRSWQPSAVAGEEGRPRDTAMYSVLRAEWPEVEARLAARIAARRD